MRNIIVRNNQTLADLAVQYTGSVEEVFELALANGISITEDLITGSELQKTGAIYDTIIEQYLADGIMPATAIAFENVQEGIGYWAINVDFKTS